MSRSVNGTPISDSCIFLLLWFPEETKLDLLVNNAGVWPTERTLVDGIELAFLTNHLGAGTFL